MSKYNELFDKIEPETDNSEFLAEIKGIKKTQQKYTKKIIPVLITAAVLMVSSLTVSAYYSGLIESLRSFFSDKNNILSDDINSVNIPVIENTFENLEFNVSGSVCDEKFTVIFIDVIRNDNKAFDNSDYILSDEKGNEMILSDGEKLTMQPAVKFLSDYSHSITSNGISLNETRRCYLVNDNKKPDNKITLAYCISNLNRELVNTFRIELENMYSEKFYGVHNGNSVILKSMTKENFNGRFICEISADNIAVISDRKLIQPGISVYLPVMRSNSIQTRNHMFNVKEISVSSVTVNIKLEGECTGKSEYIQTYGYNGIGKIILKDGTVLPFGNEALPQIAAEHCDNGKWYFEGDFVLPQTVDINMISELVIGDKTLSFSRKISP